MVIFKDRELSPKISNEVLFRFCEIPDEDPEINKFTLLEKGAPSLMIGAFSFAQRKEDFKNKYPEPISERDVWDEINKDATLYVKIVEYVASQINPKLPDDGKKKQKAK